jgi:pyridoxal phosphate enzyme (YggS family)
MLDLDVIGRLRGNLESLEQRIQAACDCAGRSRHEVTLIPITKYVEAKMLLDLKSLGLAVFGESRPQSLWEKAAQVAEVKWHLVGHLQRNKIARTLPLVDLIHSVDSGRLLEAIDAEAGKQGKVQDVLLELHLSDEPSKQGFLSEEWSALPEMVNSLHHVRVLGLMGMAALDSTPDQARATFARLRQLRDAWRPAFAAPHSLHHLSMGMTHDFQEAIEEGASLIRVGSALFEGLLPRDAP